MVATCMITHAQLQEESFDGTTLPTGWVANASPNGCTWQYGFTAKIPGSGTPQASFASGGAIFDDNACVDKSNAGLIELEGPAVDATSVSSLGIEVTYNLQEFFGFGEFEIEVWDGNAWQNVFNANVDSPDDNTGQNSITSNIDVSAYINNAFKVKFIYNDEDDRSWSLGIDHYKLLNTATAGVEELLAAGFSYYPNPVIENSLNLNANETISAVKVYNVLGQKIIESKPNKTSSAVPMTNLPTGTYIVNVAIGEKKGSFKVLKQ